MPRYPSPCVDVCRYELDGHCVQCSMTKAQKSLFGALRKPRAQKSFLQDLATQQQALLARFPQARFAMWTKAYANLCRARGAPNPFEEEDQASES